MTYLLGHSKVKQVSVSKDWNVGLRFAGGLLAVTLFVNLAEVTKENQ